MILVLERIIITDSAMGRSVDGSGPLTAIAIRSSHLIPISVRCHNLLILMALGIHLSDECSVESFSRPGINAGASSKSQQGDSRDHEEQSQIGRGSPHRSGWPILGVHRGMRIISFLSG